MVFVGYVVSFLCGIAVGDVLLKQCRTFGHMMMRCFMMTIPVNIAATTLILIRLDPFWSVILVLSGQILRSCVFLPRDARRMAVILGSSILIEKGMEPLTVDIRGCYRDACEDVSEGCDMDFTGVPYFSRPVLYMLCAYPFDWEFNQARDLVLGCTFARKPCYILMA